MMMVVESLAAVFLVIMIGWAVTARGLVTREQWAGLNWLAYYVLYPALVIEALAKATLSGLLVAQVAGVLAGGLIATALLTMALKPWLFARGVDGPAFTSVFQGAARWQTFVAFAVAASLFGREGTAIVSVSVATMIPLVNAMVVAVLVKHGRGGSEGRGFWRELVRNPFIVSCAVGIACNILGITGPAAVFGAMSILGQAGLAAALILTGVSLRLSEVRHIDPPVVVATVLKLLVMPGIVLALGWLAGLTGTAFAATLVCASVPTAAASVILAQQMGGDVPMMARIATVQTLVAMLTMPVFILVALGL